MGFISKVKKLGQGVSEALEIEAALGSKAMPLREFLMVVLDCLEKIPHVLVGGFAKLASLRWKDKADIMAMRTKSDTLDLSYIRERLWDLGISDRIEFLKLPVEE